MEKAVREVLRLRGLKIPLTVIVFKQTPINGLFFIKPCAALWFTNLKAPTSKKVSVKYEII